MTERQKAAISECLRTLKELAANVDGQSGEDVHIAHDMAIHELMGVLAPEIAEASDLVIERTPEWGYW